MERVDAQNREAPNLWRFEHGRLHQIYANADTRQLRIVVKGPVPANTSAQLRQLAASYTSVMVCLARSPDGPSDLAFFEGFESLKRLEIRDYEFSSFEQMSAIPESLTELLIGETRSKQLSLRSLQRFQNLKKLTLHKHRKDIELLQALEQLEDLTLHGVSTPNLGFLTTLHRLLYLAIRLGGARDLVSVARIPCLRGLELSCIKGISNLDPIGSMATLRDLHLQELPDVLEIPNLAGAASLHRLTVDNMKRLADFSMLKTAPRLRIFRVFNGMRQDPMTVVDGLRSSSVTHVVGGFGTTARNAGFATAIAELGVHEYDEGDLANHVPGPEVVRATQHDDED